MKYGIGDRVKKTGTEGDFTVIATKKEHNGILVPNGMDYVILRDGDTNHSYTFEDDIYLIR